MTDACVWNAGLGKGGASIQRGMTDDRTALGSLANSDDQLRGLRIRDELEPAPLSNGAFHTIHGISVTPGLGQRLACVGMNDNKNSLRPQYVVAKQLLFLVFSVELFQQIFNRSVLTALIKSFDLQILFHLVRHAG